MDTQNLRGSKALKSALQELADATTADLTLRQALVLLDVGSLTSPIAQHRLGDRHGLSKATVSRIVSNLAGTDGDIRHADGYGLLSVNMDAADMRNRYIALSSKGQRVIARAVAHVYG